MRIVAWEAAVRQGRRVGVVDGRRSPGNLLSLSWGEIPPVLRCNVGATRIE